LGAQGRDTTQKKRDTTVTTKVPTGVDSLLNDSLAKKDSLHPPKPDTIKAATAHAPLPPDIGIAQKFYWTRDSLMATGAITLADLLERVPGVTLFRAGWIAAPAAAAYLGDFQRVRVFYDGLEMRALDPRARGVLDLTQINIWTCDDALIEVAAEEVRVYLRSWRVRGTTPVTETDVSTGDQQTNLYRAYFGQRYQNGAAFQFGAQQYGTTPPNIFGASSDQLGLMGRVGWANPTWSVDIFGMRTGQHRGVILGDQFLFPTPIPLSDSVLPHDSQRSDAYIRVARGDPDTSAIWGQVMASTQRFSYSGIRTCRFAPASSLCLNFLTPKTHLDTLLAFGSLDTAVSRGQFLATMGTVRGPLRVSATERFWTGGGRNFSAPSAQASFTIGRLAIAGLFNARDADSISRTDIIASFVPVSFIGIHGSIGEASDHQFVDSSFTTRYVRGEAGLRIHGLWLLGGILQRDSIRLTSPSQFDTLFVGPVESKATAATAAIRGQLWRFIQTDVYALRWSDTTGFYRPRYQTRSELYVRTNLRERFPTNDFGLMFSVVHEYRSGVRFPVRDTTAAHGFIIANSTGYRTISTLLEIRVLSATISWQFRNLLGERYSQVPTYIMPRQTNFYGVRWQFLN
jgi:hypothetical protein